MKFTAYLMYRETYVMVVEAEDAEAAEKYAYEHSDEAESCGDSDMEVAIEEGV